MLGPSKNPATKRRPLPITIVPGMPVVDLTHDPPAASVVGVTHAYCIYRTAGTDALGVARWSDVAIGNVCPAEVLLLGDVSENDRRNIAARVLRELLALQALGLTAQQQAAQEELIKYLCQDQP